MASMKFCGVHPVSSSPTNLKPGCRPLKPGTQAKNEHQHKLSTYSGFPSFKHRLQMNHCTALPNSFVGCDSLGHRFPIQSEPVTSCSLNFFFFFGVQFLNQHTVKSDLLLGVDGIGSINFNTCEDLCNHHHNQDTEKPITPKTLPPVLPLQPHPGTH